MRRSLRVLTAAMSMGLAAFLIAAAGLPQRADYTGYTISGLAEQVAPERGYLAPLIQALDLDGQPVDLWQMRGHPVIVNFWATWCPPCREEMVILQDLHNQQPDLHVLAVNLGEDRRTVAAWRDRLDLTYNILLDTDRVIAQDYYFRDPPSTFVIDPEGRITHVFYGPVTAEQLLDAVKTGN